MIIADYAAKIQKLFINEKLARKKLASAFSPKPLISTKNNLLWG
jgi:hypothetical protein